jgi:hypothetical protein
LHACGNVLPFATPTLNLPQQVHDLLRHMLPSSCHTVLLLFQFVSSQLAQKTPGTPPVAGFPPIFEDWVTRSSPAKNKWVPKQYFNL